LCRKNTNPRNIISLKEEKSEIYSGRVNTKIEVERKSYGVSVKTMPFFLQRSAENSSEEKRGMLVEGGKKMIGVTAERRRSLNSEGKEKDAKFLSNERINTTQRGNDV